MVSRKEGLCDYRPSACLVLHSVVTAPEVDLDALSLRRTDLEHYGIVRKDLREAAGIDVRHGRKRGG